MACNCGSKKVRTAKKAPKLNAFKSNAKINIVGMGNTSVKPKSTFVKKATPTNTKVKAVPRKAFTVKKTT